MDGIAPRRLMRTEEPDLRRPLHAVEIGIGHIGRGAGRTQYAGPEAALWQKDRDFLRGSVSGL